MTWPFRRSQTPVDGLDRHKVTLDLIEEVADLRGRIRSLQIEWEDIRVQIRKGYQRMEKAADRLDEKMNGRKVEEVVEGTPRFEPVGFAKKLADLRRS